MFFSLNIPASEVLILICLPPMTFLAYRQRRSLFLCKLNNTVNSLWLQTHRNSDDLVITNSPEEWNLSRHKFKVIEDMRSLSLQNVQHSEVFTLTYSPTAKSLSLQTHILTESDVLTLTHLPTVKSLSLYTYRQRCPFPDTLTDSEVFILASLLSPYILIDIKQGVSPVCLIHCERTMSNWYNEAWINRIAHERRYFLMHFVASMELISDHSFLPPPALPPVPNTTGIVDGARAEGGAHDGKR